jgi:hypothetical protein
MSEPVNNEHPVSDVYIGMRESAFDNLPIGQGNGTDMPEIYGVVMDYGVSNGSATFTSFYTGDASMYTSVGGGFIGGFAHKMVADASREFVKVSGTYLQYMEKVCEHPLPNQGEIVFYVLTKNGVYMAKDTQKNLNEGRSQFSTMFIAGNNLITEIRTIVTSKIV